MNILKTLRQHIVKTSPEYRRLMRNYNSFIDGTVAGAGQESYKVLYRRAKDKVQQLSEMYADAQSTILDRDASNTYLYCKIQKEQQRATNQEKSLLQEIERLKNDHRSIVNSNRKLSAENAGLQMSLDLHNRIGTIPFNYDFRKAVIAGLKDLMEFTIETITIPNTISATQERCFDPLPVTITTMKLKAPLKWAFKQASQQAAPLRCAYNPYPPYVQQNSTISEQEAKDILNDARPQYNPNPSYVNSTISEQEAKDIISDSMMDSWFKNVVDKGKDILSKVK